MPKPLFTKLVAVCAIGFFCVLIGCIYSISSRDYMFLMLSLLIGVCSLVRFISLYQMFRFHRYLTLEGLCQKREPSLFQKTQHILLLTQDGRELQFALDKGVKIMQGHHYRLYFRIADAALHIPKEAPSPFLESNFLGFEEISKLDNELASLNPQNLPDAS
ncbi:hypothetical protein NE647_09785 [Blautia coccoides]|uniref:Uncharacterized protein n=1 Tax=Blautia hominis TaxID=2025493 RepID=A0ABQ0B3K4_9FIRM|nr:MULTISPECIES: hypothetical protein [Blautia]MCB5873899.1 hypothetical protein [Blautia producta]MCQ4640726.1 hypothetical protein [Blautia coccoides]